MKIIWEDITSKKEDYKNFVETTHRAKVFGGWLIKHEYFYEDVCFSEQNSNNSAIKKKYYDRKHSIVFIPDPAHKWGRMEEDNKTNKILHHDKFLTIPSGKREIKPYKCPVCFGFGHLSKHDDSEDIPNNFEYYREYLTCQACKGNGIVWG
jgi:hypothetical protein